MLFAAPIYYDSLVERLIIRAIVFSCPLVRKCTMTRLTAEVNRTTFLRQRSDGLFAGQDDPEPLNYVGLEFPQKQTSVSATVNSFTTHFMLFWKLNLCSQIDGVRGIKCDCLRKLAAHCCFCTAISLCCCHSD